MRGAVNDAADTLGIEIPELRWIATEQLEGDGTKELEGASAAWCAPGGPFRSLEGALVGIRWARESGLPFLGLYFYRCFFMNFSSRWHLPLLLVIFYTGAKRLYAPTLDQSGPMFFLAYGHALDPMMGVLKLLVSS